MGILRDDMIKIDDGIKLNLLRKVVSILDESKVEYCLEFGTLLACVRDKRIIPWDSDVDIGVFGDLKNIDYLKEEFLRNGLLVSVEHRKNRSDSIEIRDNNVPLESFFHVELFRFDEFNNMPAFFWLLRENIFARMFNSLYVIFDGETVKSGVISIKTMKFFLNFIKLVPLFIRRYLVNIFETLDFCFSTKRMLVFPEIKTKKISFYDMMVRIPEDAEDHLLLNYGINWKTPDKNFSGGGKEFIVKKMNGVEICMLPGRIA